MGPRRNEQRGGGAVFLSLSRRFCHALARGAANAHATPWLVLHVVGSATALLFGALQLLPRVRRRWPWMHRWIGRLYASGCLLGGVGGLIMAFGSTAGPWATLGFGTLAIVWLGTTVMAWRTAIARDFTAHRAWAIRSWSLTFAAVTFRLCLPIFPLLGLPFVEGYRAASIYSWLMNLGLAEWIVRRSPRAPRARLQGTRDLSTVRSKLYLVELKSS